MTECSQRPNSLGRCVILCFVRRQSTARDDGQGLKLIQVTSRAAKRAREEREARITIHSLSRMRISFHRLVRRLSRRPLNHSKDHFAPTTVPGQFIVRKRGPGARRKEPVIRCRLAHYGQKVGSWRSQLCVLDVSSVRSSARWYSRWFDTLSCGIDHGSRSSRPPSTWVGARYARRRIITMRHTAHTYRLSVILQVQE